MVAGYLELLLKVVFCTFSAIFFSSNSQSFVTKFTWDFLPLATATELDVKLEGQ